MLRHSSSKGEDFTVMFYEEKQKYDEMWQKCTIFALFLISFKINKIEKKSYRPSRCNED